MVAPAGTTFGVADPTSTSMPVSPRLPTNRAAGSELRLSTVTVQLCAFGGTGPAAAGSGVGLGVGLGTGVGLGKTGGAGLGKAGNGGGDTPAGTYSSTAPCESHSPSSSQTRPPALRTVPSSMSVNVDPSAHWSILEAVVHDPVRGSYSSATVQARWTAGVIALPATSTVPSDNSVGVPTPTPGLRRTGAQVPAVGS